MRRSLSIIALLLLFGGLLAGLLYQQDQIVKMQVELDGMKKTTDSQSVAIDSLGKQIEPLQRKITYIDGFVGDIAGVIRDEHNSAKENISAQLAENASMSAKIETIESVLFRGPRGVSQRLDDINAANSITYDQIEKIKKKLESMDLDKYLETSKREQDRATQLAFHATPEQKIDSLEQRIGRVENDITAIKWNMKP